MKVWADSVPKFKWKFLVKRGLHGSQTAIFLLCPHMVEGARELSGVSSIRALMPSCPNHLPNASPRNIITLGMMLAFTIPILGGYKHWVYSRQTQDDSQRAHIWELPQITLSGALLSLMLNAYILFLIQLRSEQYTKSELNMRFLSTREINYKEPCRVHKARNPLMYSEHRIYNNILNIDCIFNMWGIQGSTNFLSGVR